MIRSSYIIAPKKQSNLVIVNSVADLPVPVADVITLEDGKEYRFSADVFDFGNNRIVCGANNTITGVAVEMTIIESSITTGTFITSNTPNGSLKIENLAIQVNDAELFDIDGIDTFIMEECWNYTESAIGRIHNVGTVRINQLTSFIAYATGWIFSGANMGTVLFDRTGFVNAGPLPAPNSVEVLAGTEFNGIVQFAGCLVLAFGASVGIHMDGTTVFAFGEQSYKIVGVDFRGGGTAITGVTQSSEALVVRASYGIENTRLGQEYYFDSTTPLATVITLAGDPVKANGATNVYSLNKGFDHPTDNQAKFVSQTVIKVEIRVALTIVASLATQFVSIYVAKNGVVNPNMKITVPNGTNGIFGITQCFESVAFDDEFEVWIANETNTDPLTVISGNVHVLEL